ncbi:MAG TPA: DUF4290 domain-containing protein, partial [Puia sp.]|nr:DUF4290 domain-containing protein [Puia sp.]
VHDDAIQSELSSITGNQLEFTNTPFVRSFRSNENRNDRDRDRSNFGDYRNKRNQKFQQRNNNRNNDRGGNKFKKKRF